MPTQATHDRFTLSDDPARLDFGVVHGFLTRCYWSEGISRALVEKAARGSMVFGAYDPDALRADGAPGQVAYARVISDQATYAYLCDVFVLEPWRGLGLSKALVRFILAHPDLQGLRRFCLLTWDAHGVYTPFGFAPLADPSRYLEIARPGLYKKTPP